MAKIIYAGIDYGYSWENDKQTVIVEYATGTTRRIKIGHGFGSIPNTVREWLEKNAPRTLGDIEAIIDPFGMSACMSSVSWDIEVSGKDPSEMLKEFRHRAETDVFFNKTMITALEQYMEEHGMTAEEPEEDEEEPEDLPKTEEEGVEDVTDVIAEFRESTEYAEFVCDYGSSEYICDVFSYIADANTSIYWSDIIDFISKNVEMVSDTINELGWDGCGADLYKAGQMAEFRSIETELNENIVDVLKVYAFNYYREQHGEHIRTETKERIINHIDDHWGDFDTLEDIEEIVNEYASC